MPKQLVFWMLVTTASAGALCYVLNRWLRALSALIAVLASSAAFVLGLLLFQAAGTGGAGLKFPLADVSFQLSEKSAFTLDVRVTSLSGLIVLGTALFGVLIVVYSLRYARKQTRPGKYYAFTLWALGGAFLAALSNNLLLLLLSWEFVTLMLYLLVGLGREGSREGAAKSFVLLGLSDCALLMGIALLCFSGAGTTLKMDELFKTPLGFGEGEPAIHYVIYVLFLLGAITKAGAMPFHTWIPAASEGAPLSVMAFLPAAVDKLLGIYLTAIVSLQMFQTDGPQMLLLIIGAVTILFAVMMAMVQHDVRRLLSYHAISQVGYMLLGIGTGTVVGIAGGLFHMINHAIYKSCLFMGAGAVEDRTGETRVDKLGGLAGAMPLTFAAMFVAAMSISGIPPFNGFVSKWMVYQGTVEMGREGMVFLVAAVFGSALTLASFIKVLHSMFFGPKPEGMKEEPARLGGKLSLGLPMTVLALLCIVLGVAAQVPLSRLIAPAMTSLGVDLKTHDGAMLSSGRTTLDFARGLWSPGVATLLILLGIVLGLVVFLLGRGAKVRVAPPFLAGETYTGDQARYAGTSFYKTVEELPVIRTIYHDAENGVYDLYYVGGKYGDTLVQLLRRIHNGQLPLYLTWCIIGLTIIVVFLVRIRP